MIDYIDLLRRYIDFVGEQEGISFISRIRPENGFSKEEIAELKRLSGEEDR